MRGPGLLPLRLACVLLPARVGAQCWGDFGEEWAWLTSAHCDDLFHTIMFLQSAEKMG